MAFEGMNPCYIQSLETGINRLRKELIIAVLEENITSLFERMFLVRFQTLC